MCFALTEGLQDRHQEKWIAFGLAMQAIGQAGKIRIRISMRRDDTFGIGITQPGKRHTTRFCVTVQALDQLREALIAIDRFVPVCVDHEYGTLCCMAGEIV